MGAHLILHYSLMHPKLWFREPYLQCCAAVNCAMTFLGKGSWGNWFSVEFRTAIRSGILLDSDTISLLNPGQEVHVVQKFGRRVQIDQPFCGFCSLHDGAGLVILKPLPNESLLVDLTGFEHDD